MGEPDEEAGVAHGATASRFMSTNLHACAIESVRAHDGDGEIGFSRLVHGADVEGALNFVDLAILGTGTSIGRHRHGPDEEEYYLILDGTGTMTRGGSTFTVRAGDLVRNPPGESHSLVNTGDADLRVFVFEVEANR